MPDDTYDFAIVGSNLLSSLLAGLLVRDHGKRVVRIGRKPSAQRLPRGLDLALLPATRPATWQMLRDGDAETRAIITAIGGELTNADVEIHADTEASLAALDHIAHIAAGYRVAVRRLDKAWQFRGVTLSSPIARADAWLDGLGVPVLDADTSRLSFEAGAARVTGIEAGQIVLADDSSVLDLDEATRPPTLKLQSITMTVLEMRHRPGAALRFYADRGVTLMPRDPRTLLARIRGDSDVDARLASALAGPFPIHRLATARYRTLVSSDAAPVIGKLEPSQLFVVGGLEEAAAFFAPMLARLLAGKASASEQLWLAAHDPARPRDAVAEFVP